MGMQMMVGLYALVGLALTGLMATGLVLYIRRTWQQLHGEQEGSAQEQILDGLDQVQMQLHAMSERMDRLERRLGAPASDDASGNEPS